MNKDTGFKETNIDWIGKIPSNWELIKPKFKLNRVTRPIDDQDEIITCFRDGTVTLRKNRREDGFTNSIKEHGYQQIRPGDLVIHEMDGFAGAIGISDSKGKSTPVYTVIEPNEEVDLKYILFLLREMSNSGKIESLAKSIRERTTDFRYKIWSTILFPFPPINEQKKISRYLEISNNKIDKLINDSRKKINLLEELKTVLINQCISKGLDKNIEFKDTKENWIKKIPVHWSMKPIGSLLIDRNEKNDPIKTTNILSLSADKGVTPYSEKGAAGNKSKEDLTQYKIACEGDIVVNSMNIVSGSVGISNYKGLVSPVYYMLRPANTEDLVKYFYYIFKDQQFQKSLFGVGTGILFKESKKSGKFNTVRLRIPLTKLKSIKIPYTNPQEQKTIVNYLEGLDKKYNKIIEFQKKKIDLLNEYRKSLISNVVTGKQKVF